MRTDMLHTTKGTARPDAEVFPGYRHSASEDTWGDLRRLAVSLGEVDRLAAAAEAGKGAVDHLEARLVEYAAAARLRHPSRWRAARR